MSKSTAIDGIPPDFLRHYGWQARTRTLKNFNPTPALGVDDALRTRLPELDLGNPVEVGKWYCPFIFIRDGEVGVQMRKSPYYEMTLQQNWEEIFGCYNDSGGGGVMVDVCVRREAVLVGGALLAAERVVVSDGIMWFGPWPSEVGLSMAIVERVKWEEERVGFVWGRNHEEEIERVLRREEFEGEGVWKRVRCYVLVERFVLKRMDATLVLTWEFRHTHQIRTKWENEN